MLFFIRLLKPHARQMAVGTGLGFLALAAGTGLMALAAWFLTRAALAGLDPATAHLFNFFLPSIGVRVLAFGRTAARYGERLACHDATFAILASLRTWFYRRIEPLAPGVLGRYRSGDLLGRIGADIDALDNLYIRVVSPGVIAVAAAGTMGVLLLLLDSRLALAALGCYALAGAGAIAAGALGWREGQGLVRAGARLRTAVVDGLEGMAEVLVFDGRPVFLARVARLQDDMINGQRRLRRCAAAGQSLILLWAGCGLTTVLYIGAGLVADSSLGAAALALVALAVWAGFEAFYPLADAAMALGSTREAGKRILDLAGTPPAVCFPLAGAPVPERFDLEWNGLGFAYEGGPGTVFNGFCLRVAQGQKVAIIGPSGCGKSTLVHLLMRFADPQAGDIRIGGTAIRAFAESDLRCLMGVLEQQGHLFGATIRDNLLLAKPEAKDGDLAEVLEAVRLKELVDSLPEGLDTWIGEGGRTLSGGQARRLALARVLLKDAPIVILDEPFASLDRATAAAVMAAVMDRCRDRTLILITHQRFGLEAMDRVIDLDRPITG